MNKIKELQSRVLVIITHMWMIHVPSWVHYLDFLRFVVSFPVFLTHLGCVSVLHSFYAPYVVCAYAIWLIYFKFTWKWALFCLYLTPSLISSSSLSNQPHFFWLFHQTISLFPLFCAIPTPISVNFDILLIEWRTIVKVNRIMNPLCVRMCNVTVAIVQKQNGGEWNKAHQPPSHCTPLTSINLHTWTLLRVHTECYFASQQIQILLNNPNAY